MAAGRFGPHGARRWREQVGRRRRLLAALLAAAAVVLAVAATRPRSGGPPAGTPVVVAAVDLTGGTILTPGDLREVRLPGNAVPAGVVSGPDAVVGRTLAGSVRRGEPLTDVRLVGPGLLGADQAGAGLVAAPVRIADPASVALVRAGDRVDVLATATGLAQDSDAAAAGGAASGATLGGASAPASPAAAAPASPAGLGAGEVTRVADDVTVIAVPREAADSSSASDDGALLVLATSRSTAVLLAGAAVTSRLSITLR